MEKTKTGIQLTKQQFWLKSMRSLQKQMSGRWLVEQADPPETEEDELVLRLKGFEPSFVDTHWVRYS